MQPEYPIELAGSGVSKCQQPGVNSAGRTAQTVGQDGGQSFRDAGLKDTARSCSGATEHLTLHLQHLHRRGLLALQWWLVGGGASFS